MVAKPTDSAYRVTIHITLTGVSCAGQFCSEKPEKQELV